MALGVTACTANIHQAFVSDDKLKTFFHGHSFTANPLACTAALASYDLLMKDECFLQIRMIVEHHQLFLSKLQKLKANASGVISGLRQCGTIIAFEVNEPGNNYLNPVSKIIAKKALKRGVLIRPLGNTVYVLPPYCITSEELEKVYGVITGIIEEMG